MARNSTWHVDSISDRRSQPAPIRPAWIRGGSPVAQARSLFSSDDGQLSVTIWECSVGEFQWQFNSDEVIHVLEGEVEVDGKRLSVGSVAFFPAGSTAYWRVISPVRKLAIHRSLDVPLWRRAARKAKRAVVSRLAR